MQQGGSVMINMAVPARHRQVSTVEGVLAQAELSSTVVSISIQWAQRGTAFLDVDPLLGLDSSMILDEFGATTQQKMMTLVLGLRHAETARVVIFDFVQGSTDKCMLQIDIDAQAGGGHGSGAPVAAAGKSAASASSGRLSQAHGGGAHTDGDDVIFGVAAHSELPLARLGELEEGATYELLTADIRRVQFVPRLTKDEINKLRAEFDSIDEDGDGLITLDQLDASLEEKKREQLRKLHEAHTRQRAMTKNPDPNAQKAIDELFMRMLSEVVSDKKKMLEELQTPTTPTPLQQSAQMTPSERNEESANKRIDFSEFLCVRAKAVIEQRPANVTKTTARRARAMTVKF